jgi:hypothetical protein
MGKYEQLIWPAFMVIVFGLLTLMTSAIVFESVRGFIFFTGSLSLLVMSILACRAALRRR